MATPVLSRRERIVREIARRARALRAGQPTDDPYEVEFGLVTRGGVEPAHAALSAYNLAILDTDEVAVPKIQQQVRKLTVVLEFHALAGGGDDGPGGAGNKVLAALQRLYREDLNLTEPDDGVRAELDRQLSENVEEVRNQLFIEGYDDRRVTGALFLLVTYKTKIDDPRLLI